MLCWGNASFGQLGLGGIDEEVVLEPRSCSFFKKKRILDVGCGRRHTVFVIHDGTVYTCGCNDLGQLGHEKGRKRPEQIAAGGAHTFALTLSGAVFGWGRNKFGQLGLNDEKDRHVPTLLKSLRTQKVVYICCGEDHTATLTKEGGVFTFGAGGYGQLGHNSTNHEINPRKVFELMGNVVTQIACGRQHTLAFVPSSGKLHSFGLGGNGQLGTGFTSNRKSPSIVKAAWAVHNVSSPPDVDDDYFCVKAIYSGGDQSFAHYTSLQNSLPADDFRNSVPSKRIFTLNNKIVCRWMNNASGRPSSEIIDEIDTVFSSAGCLNGSFLARSNDDHYKTSHKYSGINMNTSRLLFHKLIQSDHPQISQQVAASMEKNLIPRFPKSPPDIEAMRVYITLTECPLLSDPNNYVTLAIPFAASILRLEKTPLKVLENWWSTLEPAFFQKVVQLYKEIVVSLLQRAMSMMTISERRDYFIYLQTALKILEILHRVNETAGQIIHYAKFYIHELQDLIDIRNDYITWIQHHAFRMDFSSGTQEDIPITICTYPFVFNAQAKTALLQTDAMLQMQIAVDQANRQNFSSFFLPVVDAVNPCLVLIVRREHIVEDAVEALRKSKNVDYKKPLKVIFVGEEAIDAGGVRKEFFLLIMRELLDPKYGMFQYYEESRLIWFSFQTFEDNDLFHLIGIVCGLAIYNFTIVDLPFPLALYKKLLKYKTTLDDLKELIPDVGRSLQQLLDYPEDNVKDIFFLNFTITEEKYGVTQIKELIPNGTNTSVTNENRHEFVEAYVDYVFNKSVAPLFDAFFEGFHKVCGGKVLQLFQPNELQAMVIGNANYDWKELEKNTEYKGEYGADHPTIKFFWAVFHELSLEKKKQFLLFLTGSDRIPILGMKSLKIVIQPTGGGNDYLPVAHTCFNLLDLPKYTDQELLQNKLIQAIDHYEGFSLV
ncbi:probable E3 ubiquitin-protein ligase HERC4 isoform X3 [Callorhinchus milii]|uniref:probable E3 ubiquitin-protein ligase HERC4 isoform X3 n=1 Tax=Callorhinchus milii TaxID=7868 RepID=UPI0004575912|nr:probable E3 ubiquitin-protein ligase HERC4 isoform X3 [Callorhinchus milii]|eukprot:gi/632936623/ref/XP_007895541.1/ PREDICTED: probable E3 ubiquitin-protein ligase HERC4 isoform X3 [Callorhinchus milii]